MPYKQDAPFTIQVELTQGCNVNVPRSDGTKGLCEFCGINGIREKPGNYKYMTVETAERLAKQIAAAGWTSQLLFAMHGEPSMNPNITSIISTFRQHLPKAYMVMLSNGGGLIKEGRVQALFDAGLNTIAIDDYEGAGLAERIKTETLSVPIMYYPANKEANPHHRSAKKKLVFVEDISAADKGTHATLNNHAGCGAPPNKDFWGKRCAKPFREIGVQWDGTVSGCCVMWRNEIEAGNTNNEPIDQIWVSPTMDAMRRILIQGRRDLIKVCSGCDHPSYRVGLLPDKFGKVKLSNFTDDDVELLANNKPTTVITIVRRAWEK